MRASIVAGACLFVLLTLLSPLQCYAQSGYPPVFSAPPAASAMGDWPPPLPVYAAVWGEWLQLNLSHFNATTARGTVDMQITVMVAVCTDVVIRGPNPMRAYNIMTDPSGFELFVGGVTTFTLDQLNSGLVAMRVWPATTECIGVVCTTPGGTLTSQLYVGYTAIDEEGSFGPFTPTGMLSWSVFQPVQAPQPLPPIELVQGQGFTLSAAALPVNFSLPCSAIGYTQNIQILSMSSNLRLSNPQGLQIYCTTPGGVFDCETSPAAGNGSIIIFPIASRDAISFVHDISSGATPSMSVSFPGEVTAAITEVISPVSDGWAMTPLVLSFDMRWLPVPSIATFVAVQNGSVTLTSSMIAATELNPHLNARDLVFQVLTLYHGYFSLLPSFSSSSVSLSSELVSPLVSDVTPALGSAARNISTFTQGQIDDGRIAFVAIGDAEVPTGTLSVSNVYGTATSVLQLQVTYAPAPPGPTPPGPDPAPQDTPSSSLSTLVLTTVVTSAVSGAIGLTFFLMRFCITSKSGAKLHRVLQEEKARVVQHEADTRQIAQAAGNKSPTNAATLTALEVFIYFTAPLCEELYARIKFTSALGMIDDGDLETLLCASQQLVQSMLQRSRHQSVADIFEQAVRRGGSVFIKGSHRYQPEERAEGQAAADAAGSEASLDSQLTDCEVRSPASLVKVLALESRKVCCPANGGCTSRCKRCCGPDATAQQLQDAVPRIASTCCRILLPDFDALSSRALSPHTLPAPAADEVPPLGETDAAVAGTSINQQLRASLLRS